MVTCGLGALYLKNFIICQLKVKLLCSSNLHIYGEFILYAIFSSTAKFKHILYLEKYGWKWQCCVICNLGFEDEKPVAVG